MSRIGRKVIEVPATVQVSLEQTTITVQGPKGTLSRQLHKDMIVQQEGAELTVSRPSDNKLHRSLHGTTRTIINNMVVGVNTGFEKKLELVGVGYRVQKQGNKLVLSLGFSHPVEVVEENGITFDVPAQTQIIVKGIDKERVGAVAAQIRELRPPEPYKGKGVKYEGERILRKEGKTGKGKKK
jgi:large subunit ribosomal protein L6